ncbi:MAG: 3-oxo-tetronate kinase [Pseudomonadota bacterium]
MLLGCIGDDFTGSSDLALTLSKEGMRTVVCCGVPNEGTLMEADSAVVALKSRTCPVPQAVEESLAALAWLRRQGCQKFFFKYCSTFDSTPQGNIGPVIDALMAELQCDLTIVCPAFPATGRTLYNGHLFVQDHLLNESGMENHPLTPMTDPDIRRWLAPQSSRTVGHVPHQEVTTGSDTIRSGLQREAAAGRSLVVVDAICEADLRAICLAARDVTLITGGSGIALGLPSVLMSENRKKRPEHQWRGSAKPAVVLAGSCSKATLEQVARYREDHPSFQIDPDLVIAGSQSAAAVADWAVDHLDRCPMIFSSADPSAIRAVQEKFGRDRSSTAIEIFFAEMARLLHLQGVGRLVAAGGETSGAVTAGLEITALEVGPEIAPGVPALQSKDPDLVLALKSGNFGGPDFLAKAVDILGDTR